MLQLYYSLPKEKNIVGSLVFCSAHDTISSLYGLA